MLTLWNYLIAVFKKRVRKSSNPQIFCVSKWLFIKSDILQFQSNTKLSFLQNVFSSFPIISGQSMFRLWLVKENLLWLAGARRILRSIKSAQITAEHSSESSWPPFRSNHSIGRKLGELIFLLQLRDRSSMAQRKMSIRLNVKKRVTQVVKF